jgi:8-amino-7-oxononanoate synthase
LIFNSGYDANLGFFSSVPQRGDLVVYDEYVHASIRDGIRMSLGKSFKFKHNDLDDLRQLLRRIRQNPDPDSECYIATEAVFSMDGDKPDLDSLVSLCDEFGCKLVLDEAHAIEGIDRGISDLNDTELVRRVVLARVVTFGKAMGIQGAALLSGEELKAYLLNYARSFIYTTALPPMSIASILFVHRHMDSTEVRERTISLRNNINLFLHEIDRRKLKSRFIPSRSAIHSCVIPGNERVKKVAEILGREGFDIRPILAPTVPEGAERIRFCLHSYNTRSEIMEVLSILAHAIEEHVHA